MEHILRLHPKPFHNIERGVKRVETRLLDEKRQQIKIWDALLFINRDDPEKTLHATVVELFKYSSFNEMFKELHKEYRPRLTREELEDSMLKYYSPEDEQKYWVIGIKFKLI